MNPHFCPNLASPRCKPGWYSYTYPVLATLPINDITPNLTSIDSSYHQVLGLTDPSTPHSTPQTNVNFQDTVEMRYLKRLCCSGGNQSSTTSCLSSAKDRILESWWFGKGGKLWKFGGLLRIQVNQHSHGKSWSVSCFFPLAMINWISRCAL